MALTVRITSEDGTVQELQLEPGAEIQISAGDSIAIVDSQGRPIEIAVDDDNENNVIVTILAPQGQQQVIIDGIVYGGGAGADQTFTFVDLALYVEDEDVASSISFIDPDSEEVTVVAEIEELLAGFSTAAGGTEVGAGFTPGIAPDPNGPNFANPLGLPPQDPPFGGGEIPGTEQSDNDGDEDDEGSEPGSVTFLADEVVLGPFDTGSGTGSGSSTGTGEPKNEPLGESGGTLPVDIDVNNALLITDIAQGGPVQVIGFPASALLHTGPAGAVSLTGKFNFAEGIESISLNGDTVTILMNPSFPNADLDAFTYDYEDSEGTQTATVGIMRDVPGALDGIAKPDDPSDEINLGNDANNILVNLKGNEEILGGIGDDVLVGGESKDTLVGGTGSDILTGGDGNDIFVINAEDVDTGTDTVTDFDPTIGKGNKPSDLLDLSDIFVDAGIAADNSGDSDDNLLFADLNDDGDAEVYVKLNGESDFGDAIVVLLNVNFDDLTLGGNVIVDV